LNNGNASGSIASGGASSTQTATLQLTGPVNPSTHSGVRSCSLLTEQEVVELLGSEPSDPSGGRTADGEGNVCEYLTQTLSPNTLTVTQYPNMSMSQFNSHSWSLGGGPTSYWDVSDLGAPAYGQSSDVVGQLGFRKGGGTIILEFGSGRFIGNASGLRSAVIVLAKAILDKS
jgi:hypothetical protein